jgi:hypothetical protein
MLRFVFLGELGGLIGISPFGLPSAFLALVERVFKLRLAVLLGAPDLHLSHLAVASIDKIDAINNFSLNNGGLGAFLHRFQGDMARAVT